MGTGLRALRPTEGAEGGGVKGGRAATAAGGGNLNPSFCGVTNGPLVCGRGVGVAVDLTAGLTDDVVWTANPPGWVGLPRLMKEPGNGLCG